MGPAATAPLPAIAPLFAPIESLGGINAGMAERLAKAVGGARVVDVLFHLPERSIDRRYRPPLAAAVPGRVATLDVVVRTIRRPERPRQPWQVRCTDAGGGMESGGTASGGAETLTLTLFAPGQARGLAVGQRVTVSGMLELYAGQLAMSHPEHLVPAPGDGGPGFVPQVEAVWPLTAGVSNRMMGRAVRGALRLLPVLPEWLDAELVRREGWPGFADALRAVHLPDGNEAGDARARKRLALDELLADQVSIGQAKRRDRSRPGRALCGNGALRAEALARFGHALTGPQVRVLAEIDADLGRPHRMLRLLQGDVGAGKTLVALLAMLRAAEAGAQGCMMAPTEILARQHLATLEKLSPVPVVMLTGTVKGRARRRVLDAIESGEARLVVGTHALFQEGVAFRDLGLAVIDEQHRFGVEQRLRLGAKGALADVLVMTATPIPRTVLLFQYGEMQISRLDGKPAGRQPITTTLHKLDTLPTVVAAVRRAVAGGGQLFWVCPLVEDSEAVDLTAVIERFEHLAGLFPGRVGLAHGRQDPEVRQAALAAFAAGDTRILVATTVIEVGVDIPAATIMVIEHAERFGLAQLHQLRGRVGRGAERSFCLLLHDAALGQGARRRLSLFRDTEDGFVIAEEDFRIRGGGELMGRRQSGFPELRLARGLAAAGGLDHLVRVAWQDAERLLQPDGTLGDGRGKAVAALLAVMGRDGLVRTLSSG